MNTQKQIPNRIAPRLCAALIWAATTLATPPVFAALSGYHDSVEQIQTILQDARVAAASKQLPIEQIDRIADPADGNARRWRIRGHGCELNVELEARPPAGPGKVTYVVKQIDGCR